MNSTISTFTSAEVRQIIPQAHLVIGAALVLSFICVGFSEAEAGDVDPVLIVGSFGHGDLPQNSGANQFAADVVNQVLPELIKSDNELASRLGLTTAADVAPGQHDIRALDPYPLLIIDLKLLKEIELEPSPFPPNSPSGAGIHILSRESNWLNEEVTADSPLLPWRFLYPIAVDGVVRSSVLVAAGKKNPGTPEWKIERIGSAKLIRTLYKTERSGQRHFLIWVPALNRYYLGLIQISGPSFTIKGIGEHVEKPARHIFHLLKVEAEKIDLADPDYPPR
jgi:hypothetical protein